MCMVPAYHIGTDEHRVGVKWAGHHSKSTNSPRWQPTNTAIGSWSVVTIGIANELQICCSGVGKLALNSFDVKD